VSQSQALFSAVRADCSEATLPALEDYVTRTSCRLWPAKVTLRIMVLLAAIPYPLRHVFDSSSADVAEPIRDKAVSCGLPSATT